MYNWDFRMDVHSQLSPKDVIYNGTQNVDSFANTDKGSTRKSLLYVYITILQA